jgi:hypothetical protein
VREELLFQTGAPELVVQIPALLVLDGRCCIRKRGRGQKKTKSDRRMNEEKSKIFDGEIDKRQHLVGIHGCSSLSWGKKQSVVDGGAATRTREEEGKALSLSLSLSRRRDGFAHVANIVVGTQRAHLHGHYFEVRAPHKTILNCFHFLNV